MKKVEEYMNDNKGTGEILKLLKHMKHMKHTNIDTYIYTLRKNKKS